VEEKWLLAPSLRIGNQWVETVARNGQPVVNLRVKTVKNLALDLASPVMASQSLALVSAMGATLIISRLWQQLKTQDQKEYTLKLSRPDTDSSAIDFQNSLLKHLVKSNFPLDFPVVVPLPDGKDYIYLENKRFLRLHQWVPGRMLDEVNPQSPQLLESWGEACGLLSKHLYGFDHPFAHRFYKWNPSEVLVSKKFGPYFQTDQQRELANYFWNLYESKASRLLSSTRKSVNYNDAHTHNILCNFELKDPRVCGIIDFGDALYTDTINELAIACAYACMDKPDPIEAACHLVKGYHKIFPIEENELAIYRTTLQFILNSNL